MQCTGAQVGIMDAFSCVALAIEELRELGVACESKVGELMKKIGDGMVVICGMWHECAERLVAKCSKGGRLCC